MIFGLCLLVVEYVDLDLEGSEKDSSERQKSLSLC